MQKEYVKLKRIEGPLIVLRGVKGVAYGDLATIRVDQTETRRGKVVGVSDTEVIVQVFEGTHGIATDNVAVKFTGKPLHIPLSKQILGRTFNGIGEPIDGGVQIVAKKMANTKGRPINPVSREYPKDFIQTGISAIDGLMTLIRGQKLPVFSGNGISHNELTAQIIRQAKIKGATTDNFAVVFAGMGLRNDDASFFVQDFSLSGVLEHVAMYLNLADDPIVERIQTPRCALTAAEYLAFEEGMHVLVVLTDMTSYSEGLREIASMRGEIPSRKGYPGYLYSDLATLYERAGMLKDREGSITLIPILTMPNDDITHPIPDLTGFITEGQIVLSRELNQKNIYPPITVLPSLSRLMKDGIGESYTREDHPDLANQLFSAYSRVQEVRSLAQIIGESDLSEIDQLYFKFGKEFEEKFVAQSHNENRTIEETLNLGWELLSILPPEELDRIEPWMIEKYYPR